MKKSRVLGTCCPLREPQPYSEVKGKWNSTQLIQIPSKIKITGSWKPEILIDRATWDADEGLPGIPKKMKRTKNAARKREEKRVEYNIIIIRSQRSDLLLFNLELGRPFFSFSFFFFLGLRINESKWNK